MEKEIVPYTFVLKGMRNAPEIDPLVETGQAREIAAPSHDTDQRIVTGSAVDRVGSQRAVDGVFVCMGNHDYFGDGEPLALAPMYAAAGTLMLVGSGSADYLTGGTFTFFRNESPASTSLPCTCTWSGP